MKHVCIAMVSERAPCILGGPSSVHLSRASCISCMQGWPNIRHVSRGSPIKCMARSSSERIVFNLLEAFN